MSRESVGIEFKALGTSVFFEIIAGPEEAEKAKKDLKEAEAIVKEKEKQLSRFDPASELSSLNLGLDEWHAASEDIVYLAKKSLGYYEKSRRLFDPRIIRIMEKIGYKKSIDKNDFLSAETYDPGEIKGDLNKSLLIDKNIVMFKERMDFSGIAKGYICDKIAVFLKDKGWRDFSVDMGGDMFLSGRNINNGKWAIDIEGIDSEKVSLGLSDEAIATSGITRRSWKIGENEFHHLVNPKRADCFQSDFLSVSVISETAENADVWAKILFLAQKKAFGMADKKKLRAVFRLKKGEPIFSAELDAGKR